MPACLTMVITTVTIEKVLKVVDAINRRLEIKGAEMG